MWYTTAASQIQRIIPERGAKELHVPVQNLPGGTVVALQNTNMPGFGQNI